MNLGGGDISPAHRNIFQINNFESQIKEDNEDRIITKGKKIRTDWFAAMTAVENSHVFL